jgi:hypothetical protein
LISPTRVTITDLIGDIGDEDDHASYEDGDEIEMVRDTSVFDKNQSIPRLPTDINYVFEQTRPTSNDTMDSEISPVVISKGMKKSPNV